MSMYPPAGEPKSELGRYRILSENAGVRVSPLALGAMSVGDKWSESMGSNSKEQAFELMDYYYDMGGNFIDTANNYQHEQSETWIGEWMAQRNNRDQMFIATKYTTDYRSHELGQGRGVNFGGNHKKSMYLSLRDSLKKLQTDYIDLFYLHWWDHTTSIPEIMDALHILVQQGKVLYLGVSDTPAWIVSAANTYAAAHGKTPFSVYQGRWNVMVRDFEREIIPMARHFGMALCPWAVMGGGHFQSRKQMAERQTTNEGIRSSARQSSQTETEVKISEALDKVGQEHGLDSPAAVAVAYVMAKTPYVFPLIGGRKVEHLKDIVKALSIKLTAEQIRALESVVPFEVGFPGNFVQEDPRVSGKPQFLMAYSAQYSFVSRPKPIEQA